MLEAHDFTEGPHRRDGAFQSRLAYRFHLRLGRRKERLARRRSRCGLVASHDVGLGRLIRRVGHPFAIAVEEAIERSVAVVRPAALACDQVDRAQEPHDVDGGRPPRGVVEIVESPGVSHVGELLDVSVPVQLDDWLAGQIGGEHLADPHRPFAVDQAEVVVRVAPDALEDLGPR